MDREQGDGGSAQPRSEGAPPRPGPDGTVTVGTEGEDREVVDLRPLLTRVLPPDWERLIAARDQLAFDAAVRRAWLVVFYRVAARTRDRGEAEEAAQEVFCRVLARMGTLPAGEAVRRAYLTRAASNLLQDQWQRRARRLVADSAFAADRTGEPADPQDVALRREETDRLVAALRSLPPVQAQVLRLRIGEELSSEEVGAVMGKSAQAVRQIQHRALEALRARLGRGAGGEG
ncbi:MAG: RNA polymerase sigma factor [Acidimicrobiales bacterium]